MSSQESDFSRPKSAHLLEHELESIADAPVTVKDIVAELRAYGMTADKYEIGKQIGKGGMSIIYRAFHIGLKRHTVLKVANPEVMADPDLLSRFVEEARITSQLEHQNIAPITDIGLIDDKDVFYSMKLIEGEELDSILTKIAKGIPQYVQKYHLSVLLSIFRKACDACAFAHVKGIVHRDVKPENIMVSGFGEVYVMDWGLAIRESGRAAPDDVANDQLLRSATIIKVLESKEQYIRGTPAFMSPEQAWGHSERIDRRTDIFLLGATLYNIATLREPYDAATLDEIVHDARTCNFIPPVDRAPERMISEELTGIILRAMALEQEDRYQNVDDLCVDIDALMKGHAISRKKVFRGGKFLIREGEMGAEAYVIQKGLAEVYKIVNGEKHTIRNVTAGDCVGELAVIAPAPRSANVLALDDTEVIVINEDIIRQGIDGLPPWLSRIVHSLVQHLRDATISTSSAAGKDYTYHAVNQIRLLYPLLMSPQYDKANNNMRAVVDGNALISEAAMNISVERDQIAAVVEHLVRTGLLRRVEENVLTIPNFILFDMFTNLVARKQALPTTLRADRTPFLYICDRQTVLTLMHNVERDTIAKVYEVVPESINTVVGCSAWDDVPAALETCYSMITGAVAPEEKK